jgi:hypothetical protein
MPTLRVRALISKEDPRHSSGRTVEEVAQIFDRANEIWRQADIQFDATVLEWKFDPASLDEIVKAAFQRRGDVDRLGEVTGPAPTQITAIYLHSIGGSNGKVFRPKRALIVVDDTTMPDFRTTAHEIGHFFDLEHWMGTDLIARDIEQVRSRLPTSGLEVVD